MIPWVCLDAFEKLKNHTPRTRFAKNGDLSFYSWVFPCTANHVGTVDLTLVPSGDPLVPENVVSVSASNLTLIQIRSLVLESLADFRVSNGPG